MKVLGSTVESSPCEELLGITIDSELTIYKHIISLCSKANQKINALARIAKYLIIDKQKFSCIHLFRNNSITYCLLIWICHHRTLNKKSTRIQEWALRIVYNDYKSNFKELLQQDYSFTIHKGNIYLAIEINEVKNGLSPVIMNNGFQFGKKFVYEHRSGNHLQRTNIQTVK